ncbi:MAG: hypothetical protein ACI9ZV_000837 [Candidatus Azotimanducaceae bacterium]|jgi:hypothetical protein
MFRSDVLQSDDLLAIRAASRRNSEMLRNPFLIALLLSLLPIFGYAQNDAYALQRILQRYAEAYGGFRDADVISSLSVEGSIEQDGQTFEFQMRKKRPHSLRYRLSNGLNSVITGYNGSSGWMRIETNGEISITSLDSVATGKLCDQARFDSPLFSYLEKGENDVELLERATLDQRSVYVIQVRELGSEINHYYLDAITAHVIRHDQLDAKGAIRFQTLYRDYREIEGYPFAYEIETRVDGVTTSLAKVHRIAVNLGLLSFYFEKPRR